MVIQKAAVVYSLPLDLMLKYFVGETQLFEAFHVRTYYRFRQSFVLEFALLKLAPGLSAVYL